MGGSCRGATLDAARANVLSTFITVNTNIAIRFPNLHVLVGYLGDIVRRWGPFTQFRSQACEALYHWIENFAKHANRKQWVRTSAMSIVVRARLEQVCDQTNRSQSACKKRAATGHTNGVKNTKRSEAKAIAVHVKNELMS